MWLIKFTNLAVKGRSRAIRFRCLRGGSGYASEFPFKIEQNDSGETSEKGKRVKNKKRRSD